MTKKDYELIAATVAGVRGKVRGHNAPGTVLGLVAVDLADALASDNPRFQRDRFLAACGVEG